MLFLGMAYEAEEALHSLSPDQWADLRRETLDYVEQLKAEGRLVDARPLKSARLAATLQIRDGHLSVTDGPFAETKEQLGGFFLFEAANFSEAVRIASKWPSARLGTIEVRPVEDGLQEERRYELTPSR